MRKNYTSPLFEEIVLTTEDVLAESEMSEFDVTAEDIFEGVDDEAEGVF